MALVVILLVFIIIAGVFAHDFEKNQKAASSQKKKHPPKPLLKKKEVLAPKNLIASFANRDKESIFSKEQKEASEKPKRSKNRMRGVSLKEAVVLKEILEPPYLKDLF